MDFSLGVLVGFLCAVVGFLAINWRADKRRIEAYPAVKPGDFPISRLADLSWSALMREARQLRESERAAVVGDIEIEHGGAWIPADEGL